MHTDDTVYNAPTPFLFSTLELSKTFDSQDRSKEFSVYSIVYSAIALMRQSVLYWYKPAYAFCMSVVNSNVQICKTFGDKKRDSFLPPLHI